MALSLKPLNEQIIVITGASSGIGLATAKAAAEKGAKLVLAARNEDALVHAVNEISSLGGQAIHVVADVGRREDVERISQAAIDQFGGFDTWINDAGVSIFGRIDEITDEDHHRLFQTNFWGVVYGSLVAVKTLKQRGGALINLGSVASDIALPLQGMYSATKHAIKGFTNALRAELADAGAPISVTLIKPAAINTPFAEHAKKYTANQPNLPPPVYEPNEVAHAILFAATHPKRDIYVGSAAKTLSLMAKNAPHLADRVSRGMSRLETRRNEPARDREGALHRAGYGGNIRGDHPGHVMSWSWYTRASLHPLWTGAAVAAVVGAVAANVAVRRRQERSWRYRRPETVQQEA